MGESQGRPKVDEGWTLKVRDLGLGRDPSVTLRRDWGMCHCDPGTKAVRDTALTTLVLHGDGTGILMPGRYADRAAPILLRAMPQPFGGVRWWFVDPDGHGLCSTLYLPKGAARFRSRRALGGISYRSQRTAPGRRAEAKVRAIRFSLRGSPELDAPFPPKPAGMHRATYERRRSQAEAAIPPPAPAPPTTPSWAGDGSDDRFLSAVDQEMARRKRKKEAQPPPSPKP